MCNQQPILWSFLKFTHSCFFIKTFWCHRYPLFINMESKIRMQCLQKGIVTESKWCWKCIGNNFRFLFLYLMKKYIAILPELPIQGWLINIWYGSHVHLMLHVSAQLIIIKIQKYLLKWNLTIISMSPVDGLGGGGELVGRVVKQKYGLSVNGV